MRFSLRETVAFSDLLDCEFAYAAGVDTTPVISASPNSGKVIFFIRPPPECQFRAFRGVGRHSSLY
jgi:hypothetical protein